LTYTVEFEPAAQKEILALPTSIGERIVAALERLATDPFKATNVKALKGGLYRLRVGDYRAVYSLKREVLVVLVVRIAHRREVYRS
jgi:mRNA interferase RelE/StbE